MPLETIVRPFQTADVSPGKTAVDTGFSDSNAPVHLQLGKDGWPPKVMQASYSSNLSSYTIRRPKEKQSGG
jgi:hypothetical protein